MKNLTRLSEESINFRRKSSFCGIYSFTIEESRGIIYSFSSRRFTHPPAKAVPQLLQAKYGVLKGEFRQNNESSPPSEGGTKGGLQNQELILTKPLCRHSSSFPLTKKNFNVEKKKNQICDNPCESVS
ncbi:MAG: hypothetical protein K9N09_06380 [Candidatus Cloacimonetes bacterium]|nr:hypothetical protein [Candidatus Cloacimonadota bacterium]MCF7813633.1 hypothetical protein [Candidatus Cloacimonadota bacterium]MCF7868312.1 hypothetical protein [Candidatus Cloacimonadota bacterium]